MVMDNGQQRKKRRSPKVKTGCATCKVRRIKCDEARPNCKRCSTTGRTCDGYTSDITISSELPTNSRSFIQRISVHIPGSTEERRAFDFFFHNTALELSGYYDSSFWERLILAASAQKPSLRHAITAIAALHEDFSRKKLSFTDSSAEDQISQFALNQYSKAMGELRRSLSNGKEEPLTALMTCVLFVGFDSLRGWFESAMVHLQSGLKILRDMRRSSVENVIIEENIVPLLRRFLIQSLIYVAAKSKHDQEDYARDLMDVSGKVLVVPEDFENLEEARNYLNQAAAGLIVFDFMWGEDMALGLQSPENLAIIQKCMSELYLWNIVFEKFMASKGKDLSSKEVQGAALLKIHHTTVKIMADAQLSMSETKFFQHSNDYQIIVNLSRSLILAAEQDAKNGKPSYTFSTDLGIVGPLYYLCINCPLLSIRTAAMELLLRCPRREGMWNSVRVAEMIQQYWDLEATYNDAQNMGIGEVDAFGFPMPFPGDGGSVHFEFFGGPIGR